MVNLKGISKCHFKPLAKFVNSVLPQTGKQVKVKLPMLKGKVPSVSSVRPVGIGAAEYITFKNQWNAWLSAGWKGTLASGGISAAIGFGFGFVDELFNQIFRGKYEWIGTWLRAITGLGLLIGTSLLIVAIVGVVINPTNLLAVIIGIVVSMICGVAGYLVGKLAVKLIYLAIREKIGNNVTHWG